MPEAPNAPEGANVDEKGHVQAGCRLEDAYLQSTPTGGGRPVNEALRVVGAIVANRGGARWVGDRAGWADDVQRRVMERQRQPAQWHDLARRVVVSGFRGRGSAQQLGHQRCAAQRLDRSGALEHDPAVQRDQNF